MKEASFRLEGYKFEKVNMDLSANPGQIGINIVPSGVYNPSNGQYDLSFVFQGFCQPFKISSSLYACTPNFLFP